MPGLAPARSLASLLEKEWDATLFKASGRQIGLAVQLGWRSYHTLRSRGSAGGYPDRTLWKGRVVFAELKRELTGAKSEDANRRPSERQVEILDGLSRAGGEVYLWRPSDLDQIAVILGRPWRFVPYSPAAPGPAADFGGVAATAPHLADAAGATLLPRSIWVPGRGRADEAGIA